jgi:hypothetical protein
MVAKPHPKFSHGVIVVGNASKPGGRVDLLRNQVADFYDESRGFAATWPGHHNGITRRKNGLLLFVIQTVE